MGVLWAPIVLTSRSEVQPKLMPVVFSLLRSTYLPKALIPLTQARMEPPEGKSFRRLWGQGGSGVLGLGRASPQPWGVLT